MEWNGFGFFILVYTLVEFSTFWNGMEGNESNVFGWLLLPAGLIGLMQSILERYVYRN